MKLPFRSADVLLPKKDFERWSVIACDQYTSKPEYWQTTRETVGNAPSTLNLIFPEVYLGKDDDGEIIKSINTKMTEYLKNGIFITICKMF